MSSRKIILLSIVIFFSTGIWFFSKNNTDSNTLVIYSSRKEHLLHKILENFTAKTGIKTKYIEDEAPQLISRMKNEKKHPTADVFMTSDVVNLIIAKKNHLLGKIKSHMLDKKIPQNLKDTENQWFGFTKRARIFAYNKTLVSKNELSTYMDLANPKWSNSILVRSSSSPYNQSLIAFMIASKGKDATESWVKGLVKNMARKPSGGDIDQIYSVEAKEGKIAIVNSYYLARIFASKDKKDIKTASVVKPFFPNQNSNGTMMNISGAGVIEDAPHIKNAIKFLEFLATDEAQIIYAQINHEYPVVQKTKISNILKSWGNFKESNLPLSDFEENFHKAVQIAQDEGWK